MGMNGFFKSLFSGLQGARANPELDAAVERVVHAVEPKLKFAGGYPQRYRGAVAHALDYVRELARQVPGPIAVNREAYGKSPFVRAIFASPDEFQTALCTSRAMQEYLKADSCGIGTPLYAVLGMRRREKAVIGMEVVGDEVRHDVTQTTVCFSSHTLTSIAHSEADSRALLGWGFINSLIGHVTDRLEQIKQTKQELEQQCSELRARLRSADALQRESLQEALDAALAGLREATEQLDLRRHAEHIDAVLLQPEQHLRLEPVTLHIDDMSIKREPGNGREVTFVDLVGRDRRRWCITLLHCQSPGVIPMSERLEEASRWMYL